MDEFHELPESVSVDEVDLVSALIKLICCLREPVLDDGFGFDLG